MIADEDLVPVDSTERYYHRKNHPEQYLSVSQIPVEPSEPPVPKWLRPSDNDPSPSAPPPVPLSEFAKMYDWVLERVAQGESLGNILNRDPRCPDVGRFIRWIMNDDTRRDRYYKAQESWSEVMLVEDMIRIADADESMEDTARSKLKLDTRWKILAVCNRKRFGDIKQIDQNVTIDLGAAMNAARERTRTIEVNPGGQYE